MPLSTTPSLSLLSPSSENSNTTHPFTLPIKLKFPPGPPSSPLDYDVPGTDLTLEFTVLGLIRGRDESVIEKALQDAYQASMTPYRPHEAISQEGYKLHEGNFLLVVGPSAQLPGEEPLRWGMWIDTLRVLYQYVDAYPGYDFKFEIWFTPPVGSSSGYLIGTGLAITYYPPTMMKRH